MILYNGNNAKKLYKFAYTMNDIALCTFVI